MSEHARPERSEIPRKVLFIAGAGRSGTSTLSGLMSILGLQVPQPEVISDASNPKGFGEPQWAVDFHDRLLEESAVQVGDSRPEAWFETAKIAAREPSRIVASQWLEQQFDLGPELVVKDPRLGWFIPLWRVAAIRNQASPVFATMLRTPAEVVRSKQTYYQNRLGSAHLTASWLNMMLHTERATRPSDGSEPGGARVFVRYDDLLSDWVRVTSAMGAALDLHKVQHAGPNAVRLGHDFVDPSLRRMDHGLDELDLPDRLHALTEQTWASLNRLAEPDGDTDEAHRELDDLRADYVRFYGEAEAVSRSSVVAVEAKARRRARRARALGRDGAPQVATGDAAPLEASHLADRVPHGVRALVPARVRRGARRVVGRERRP